MPPAQPRPAGESALARERRRRGAGPRRDRGLADADPGDDGCGGPVRDGRERLGLGRCCRAPTWPRRKQRWVPCRYRRETKARRQQSRASSYRRRCRRPQATSVVVRAHPVSYGLLLDGTGQLAGVVRAADDGRRGHGRSHRCTRGGAGDRTDRRTRRVRPHRTRAGHGHLRWQLAGAPAAAPCLWRSAAPSRSPWPVTCPGPPG